MGAAPAPPLIPVTLVRASSRGSTLRYIYTGTGRGRAGGRRSFWAAWLVTSAGHAGRNDLGRSTCPFYFDLGARAEFLLLLLADIVVRAVGVIGEQIVDLVPRGIKLFADVARRAFVSCESERVPHVWRSRRRRQRAYMLCIAGDNESNVLSAPDSQEGASQRDPCNPDVYDKSRGVCAHDNSVRCTLTAIFHLTRAVARPAPRPVPSSMYVSKAYCRGGCCSSGRGVLNDARRSSENLAAPLDRYASLNQSLSSGRNEPMYWRPGSTFIHSTRRSREVT